MAVTDLFAGYTSTNLGIAVVCLAPLVKKIHEAQVLEMTDKLCNKLLNGKDQHRDIASIAMKTFFFFGSSYLICCTISSCFCFSKVERRNN
ncbi:putative cullin-associated NEDD8-dissociated protein [Helianthus anomalus]